jgi:integrase
MEVFKRWRKSKDGSRAAFWYIRYAVNGKIRWEAVGKFGIVTKTVAQRRLEEVKRKIRMGINEYEDANVTLEILEEDYIKYVRDIKQLRTWKKRKQQLQTLKAFFQGKKLSHITPKDIEDFKSFRLENLRSSSVNRELATLKHIFNLARRWKKLFGENPVSISGLLTEDNLRKRVLSVEEENRFLGCSAPHLRPIIIMALNTGMRRGEILSLKWENVDFENNIFIINATNNKSKKIKKIPINTFLRKLLLELRLKNGLKSEYVFLGDNGKPVKDIKTAFLSACRRANIEGLRFHDLRHTAGTRMHECGVDIVAISEILGHSSIELTRKRYLHPGDSLRGAVEMLGNYNENYSQKCSQGLLEDS